MLKPWKLINVCMFCGNSANSKMALCVNCHESLPWIMHACKGCATPLLGEDIFCGICIKIPYGLSEICALFEYRQPIKYFISSLKFNHKLIYAKFFSKCFIESISKSKQVDLPQAIIPMPLHNKRIQHRGFNQAIEISRPIAKYFNIPLLRRCIIRTRHVLPQSDLSKKQRILSVKNIFSVAESKDYKHVAIVDDVMTTGSSVRSLIGTLKKSGIERIDLWVVARAVMR